MNPEKCKNAWIRLVTFIIWPFRYESNTARNFYEKLMTKYESCPYDPMSKFTKSQPKTAAKDATSTIARVKEALLKGLLILIHIDRS